MEIPNLICIGLIYLSYCFRFYYIFKTLTIYF